MNTSTQDNNRKRRINMRLTEAEYQQMMRAFAMSGDRKLSDYARKLLLGRPVKVLTRNQSLDLFMEEMIALRKELSAVGNNFNQLVRKINSVKHPAEVYMLTRYSKGMQAQLLAKVDIIKSRINQFSDQWFQDSYTGKA